MRWALFGMVGLVAILLTLWFRGSPPESSLDAPSGAAVRARPPVETSVPQDPPELDEDPTTHLSPNPQSIVGVVLGPDDVPLEGATILCLEEVPAGFARESDAPRELDQAVTNVEGRFRVTGIALADHELVVSAVGYASKRSYGNRLGDDVELRLTASARISGRVILPTTEEAVPGIAVRVGLREVQTDEEGRFAFDGLSAGRHDLRTDSPWEGWVGTLEQVDLLAGEDAEIELVLEEGRTLVGRVVDRRNYAPIEGARISTENGRLLAVTDAEGRYLIEGLSRDRFIDLWNRIAGQQVATLPNSFGRIRVEADGFAPELGSPNLEDGDVLILKFALGPAATISGRVTDGHDAIAGARVRLRAIRLNASPDSSAPWPRAAECRSDDEGRFRFDGVLADAHSYTVDAAHPGFGPLQLKVRPSGDRAQEIGTLVLVPASIITGRIIEADGVAIPGARIRVSRQRARGSWSRSSTSDDAGRFVISGVGPGHYLVSAGIADRLVSRETIVIRGPSEVHEVELVAVWAGSITGVVLDASRQPVHGLHVECAPSDGGRVSRTQTRESGEFTMRRLPDGDYQLRVRTKDLRQGVIRGGVRPGEREITLALEEMREIRGSVIDERGEPFPGAFVVLVSPFFSRNFEVAPVDALGEFIIPVESGAEGLIVAAFASGDQWIQSIAEGTSDPTAGLIDPRGVSQRCAPEDVLAPLVLLGR